MSDQKLSFKEPLPPSSKITPVQIALIVVPLLAALSVMTIFVISAVNKDPVYRGGGRTTKTLVPHDFSLHCKAIDDGTTLEGGLGNITHNSYAVYADHLMLPGTASTEYICQHFRGIIFSFGHCGLSQSIYDLFSTYAPNSTCQQPDPWLYSMNTHIRNCFRGVPRYVNLTTLSHTHFVISCDATTGLGILLPRPSGFQGAFCADLEIAIDANTRGISGDDCTTRAELDRLYGVLEADIGNCTGGSYAGVSTWQANYDALKCSRFSF